MSNVQGFGPFTFCPTASEAHGLSVAVGRLFAQEYRTCGDEGGERVLNLLEAYKYLRRALPREHQDSWYDESLGARIRSEEGPHIGHEAAHSATQGEGPRS